LFGTPISAKTILFLKFTENPQKTRGLYANCLCLLRTDRKHLRVGRMADCPATSCSLWRPPLPPPASPSTSWSCPCTPRHSPSYLSSSLARSPSSPVHACELRAQPPSIAGVPRRPSLHRRAEKLRLAALFLPVEGIDAGWPESAPASPFSLQPPKQPPEQSPGQSPESATGRRNRAARAQAETRRPNHPEPEIGTHLFWYSWY
jgi:hypothetical protein